MADIRQPSSDSALASTARVTSAGDSPRPARVVVVGGGVSGLAAALAIERGAAATDSLSPEVTVLEPAATAGGKIWTVRDQGFLCEAGPNGFLDREPKTLELARSLSLSEQLLPASSMFSKRYIYRKGKLRVVTPHPLKFLASPLLPIGAKLRLACDPWIKSAPPTDPECDESVASFATRRIGKTAMRLLIDPMQSGIYAGDPARLSVRSCFPRVVEIESQYGSLIRGMIALARQRKHGPTPGAGPSGHLTSFGEGMQTLTEALVSALGSRVRCNAPVTQLIPCAAGHGLTVRTGDGQSIEADVLVLACPARVAASLLEAVDPALATMVQQIEYAPLGVACLGYRRDQVQHALDGFGFLVPREEGLRIIGVLFSSAIFPNRAPQDHVLLRVMLGGARDPEVLEQDDQSFLANVRREIEPLLGITGAPRLARLFRHPQAIPQYNLGHQARLDRIEQRLANIPGLVLAGNAYRGIGVNDCIANAERVAETVLDTLAMCADPPLTAGATARTPIPCAS